MRNDDINCPPFAPVLMESTRAIGYSIEAAVADIIDNSISAGASEIELFFAVDPNPFVAIVDNGCGMNDTIITEAMRYGSCSPLSQRNENDLGRYGLGMKTASLSQCKCLSVVSKINNSIVGRRWDLDYISSTKEWSLQRLSQSEIQSIPCYNHLVKLSAGTVVVWQNLDKIKLGGLTLEQSLETKMDDVKKHLELVFHRYLSGDGGPRISISINGIKLAGFDPFFVTKSTVIMDDEKIEIPGRLGKVTIRPYVLPHPANMTKSELDKYGGREGLRNLQGFYIYRNRRLLTWGTWFKLVKMDEFSKLARVKVDIPNSLDDLWTLDIKKSTAYPPEIVKTRLKQIVGTMAGGSKRAWTFRQKKEVSSTTTHVWDKVETRDGVKYVVNLKHPMLDLLKDRMEPENRKLLDQYLETVQNNLPFNNLHYDMHNDVKIVHDKECEEKERTCHYAKQIIKKALKEERFEEVLEQFETIEPFMFYMKEIREIGLEVKRNG